MSRVAIARAKPLLAGFAAALTLALALQLSTASPAQAWSEGNHHFCWGTVLPREYGPEPWYCNALNSSPSSAGYVGAVWGSADNGSVCIWIQPYNASSPYDCSAPSQNDEVAYIPGNGLLGHPQIDNNVDHSNRVYGDVFYLQAPDDPPPPPDPAPVPTWHVDNLGGNIVSDPDLASRAAGDLQVFARGANNHLMHKWYNGGWSGWEDLGGSLTSGPGSESWSSSRIDVVARTTNNSIAHWAWNGSSWIQDNLGGNISSDPDICSWGYGRLDVVARGSNNQLMHRAFANGNWQPWENFGGTLASGPGCVSWGANRIDIVARATNDSVAHWAWNGASWVQDNLGGSITSDPDISSRGYGNLDIFAKGTGGDLSHLIYNGAWGWEWLGWLSGPMYSGPGAVSWSSDRIDVAGKAADGTVDHWAWN